MDVLLVRKLGMPGQEELAIGAIASGGIRILNEDIVDELGLSQSVLDRVTEKKLAELQCRERQYGGDRPAPDVRDRTREPFDGVGKWYDNFSQTTDEEGGLS